MLFPLNLIKFIQGTRGYGSKDSEFLNKELSNEKIKKNIMQKKVF
jgi:hypothetical protein